MKDLSLSLDSLLFFFFSSSLWTAVAAFMDRWRTESKEGIFCCTRLILIIFQQHDDLIIAPWETAEHITNSNHLSGHINWSRLPQLVSRSGDCHVMCYLCPARYSSCFLAKHQIEMSYFFIIQRDALMNVFLFVFFFLVFVPLLSPCAWSGAYFLPWISMLITAHIYSVRPE